LELLMNQEEKLTHSIEDQQRFWNSWNTESREQKKLDRDSLERGEMALGLLRSLNLKSPEILELGCGTGWLSEQLVQFGPTTAIDIADEVIKRAKARVPYINFLAGDFVQIPLPKSHFDVVICLETLSHVADQRLFVDGVAAVLKPGGYLILTTQNKSVMILHDVLPPGVGQIRKWLNKKGLKALLKRRFRFLRLETIVAPDGHRGVLRIVNSFKLNMALEYLMSRASVERLKRRMGFGKTLVALAQRVR
jgi:2-polyprenyl-3-methyl-5-hydroxy-6-metoxy-1,4-benzoquinol methylase